MHGWNPGFYRAQSSEHFTGRRRRELLSSKYLRTNSLTPRPTSDSGTFSPNRPLWRGLVRPLKSTRGGQREKATGAQPTRDQVRVRTRVLGPEGTTLARFRAVLCPLSTLKTGHFAAYSRAAWSARRCSACPTTVWHRFKLPVIWGYARSYEVPGPVLDRCSTRPRSSVPSAPVLSARAGTVLTRLYGQGCLLHAGCDHPW